jgi:hypothetical protein
VNKPTLVSVAAGATALDVLAKRYRAAYDKMEGGREQWIEGTLELAVVVGEARRDLPDHRAFSRWLQHHNFEPLHPNDRAALTNFSKDLEAARKLLEQTSSKSWRGIWENRPNRRNRTSTKIGKGPIPTFRNKTEQSGSYKRRNRRIPDVMREETPVPPPKPMRQLSEMFLTPQQVDPDFKGTPLEFAAKYGHVLLHTKGEREHTKRQDALMKWVGTVADLERIGRSMLIALADLDPAALAEWTSKPAKAEKLRAWCDSIQLACEAISRLRPPKLEGSS